MTRSIYIAIAIAASLATTAAAAPAVQHLRRVAIVVGANDPPPGGQALRFAHDDADQLADVLRRVGRFADVRVLLDPHPAELLAAVDDVDRLAHADGGDALVMFYYSGHSDGQSIYPHGEKLAIADLRARLARMDAQIRVGVLDTCRGGAWTQTKGLTVAPPLDPVDLLDIGTEGTALVASSAGLENAHETDAMRGSFFTHHFTAGLLGAADRNADREVTLQEAFDYAKERTIRDSAMLATTPQHPSFEINLRGRQDIVLAAAGASASALEISAPRSMLQVIYLATGLVIAEAPPSATRIRLAVAPGAYLVRHVDGSRVRAKEVAVAPGETVAVTETELELVGSPMIAVKGAGGVTDPSSPAKGQRILAFALGVATGPARDWGVSTISMRGASEAPLERSIDGVFTFSYGITDRLTWTAPVPAFSYRFGRAGELELVPRAGLTSIGYSSIEGMVGTMDAGAAVRAWASPSTSLIAAANADWEFNTSGTPHRGVLSLHANAGVAWDATPSVTLHFGAGVVLPHRALEASPNDLALATSFGFGAVQTLGYRALPLVQVRLTDTFSLDGYASWTVNVHGDLSDRYLAGITWTY